MSKKGLNIYRRKDGRYEGRYADGFGENGKTKYRSIYGKTYTEVKEKLLQIKARVLEVVFNKAKIQTPFIDNKRASALCKSPLVMIIS